MMAMSEDRAEARNGHRQTGVAAAAVRIVLSIVLANAGLVAFAKLLTVVSVLGKAGLLWGPPHWASTGRLALFLLLVLGAIAALLWLRPWKALAAISAPPEDEESAPQRLGAASLLLGNVMLIGLASIGAIIAAVVFDPRIGRPVNPMTWAFVALHMLVAAGGFWGLRRLRPWVQREPLSPSTRRTNALFGLSGLVCVPGVLALAVTSISKDNPFGLFTNGPVPLWAALFAIAGWVVGMWLGWKWYSSADEHERQAYDFGSLVGAGLFTVLAPVWWVAARAGLVPQPDAMVLWLITMIALSIGWIWRRNR